MVETITKPNLTLNEAKLMTLGQRKRKEYKNMKFTYGAMAIFVNI
jgi:hypothetical protein